MMNLYKPIIKLGEAEIRALENTSKNILDQIEPIIEITRGRKRTASNSKEVEELYPFNNRLEKLKQLFNGKNISIDLTSDESLTSKQIIFLYNPEDGYKNWINFLCELKKENIFSNITPCLIINGNDDNFEKNLKQQAQSLVANFGKFIYRNSLLDENCYGDLKVLDSVIDNMIFLLDCEYVSQAQKKDAIVKLTYRIDNLSSMTTNRLQNFIISATSFPKNISEIGDDKTDQFSLCEVEIHNKISDKFNHLNIVYSDYASINPIRNDNIVMARGWIPRIDVPLMESIYYIRERRPKGITSYASTYCEVARQVVNTKQFPQLYDNWGINQILDCSEGASPSSAPSFWISVRMCIHIEQQCRRIYTI